VKIELKLNFTLIIHKFTSSFFENLSSKNDLTLLDLKVMSVLCLYNCTTHERVGSTDRRQLSDLAVFARLLVECRAIASRRVLLLLQIFEIFARTENQN